MDHRTKTALPWLLFVGTAVYAVSQHFTIERLSETIPQPVIYSSEQDARAPGVLPGFEELCEHERRQLDEQQNTG